MTEAKIILTTFPDTETARQIGADLLKKKLIACINILPTSRSLYLWENELHDESECPAILKTSNQKLAVLEKKFHELHPYEVPEFIVLSPTHLSPAYEKWLAEIVA